MGAWDWRDKAGRVHTTEDLSLWKQSDPHALILPCPIPQPHSELAAAPAWLRCKAALAANRYGCSVCPVLYFSSVKIKSP